MPEMSVQTSMSQVPQQCCSYVVVPYYVYCTWMPWFYTASMLSQMNFPMPTTRKLQPRSEEYLEKLSAGKHLRDEGTESRSEKNEVMERMTKTMTPRADNSWRKDVGTTTASQFAHANNFDALMDTADDPCASMDLEDEDGSVSTFHADTGSLLSIKQSPRRNMCTQDTFDSDIEEHMHILRSQTIDLSVGDGKHLTTVRDNFSGEKHFGETSDDSKADTSGEKDFSMTKRVGATDAPITGNSGEKHFSMTKSAKASDDFTTGKSGEEQFCITQCAGASGYSTTGNSGEKHLSMTKRAAVSDDSTTGKSGEDQLSVTRNAESCGDSTASRSGEEVSMTTQDGKKEHRSAGISGEGHFSMTKRAAVSDDPMTGHSGEKHFSITECAGVSNDPMTGHSGDRHFSMTKCAGISVNGHSGEQQVAMTALQSMHSTLTAQTRVVHPKYGMGRVLGPSRHARSYPGLLDIQFVGKCDECATGPGQKHYHGLFSSEVEVLSKDSSETPSSVQPLSMEQSMQFCREAATRITSANEGNEDFKQQ